MSRYQANISEKQHFVELSQREKKLHCRVGNQNFVLEILQDSPPYYTVRTEDGHILSCQICNLGGTTMITSKGWCWTGSINELTGQNLSLSSSSAVHGNIKAPMPGRIVAIPGVPGSLVQKGDPVIIIEAMKMQNALTAPISGSIQTIHAQIGETVESGKILVTIT